MFIIMVKVILLLHCFIVSSNPEVDPLLCPSNMTKTRIIEQQGDIVTLWNLARSLVLAISNFSTSCCSRVNGGVYAFLYWESWGDCMFTGVS